MDLLTVIAIDLVAISLLAFGVYYPRHRRRDLAVAFVGVNVGVLAVSLVLAGTTVGAGLGLGLFGVLSIIRLRSREIEQSEMAYYLAALALGLVAGLSTTVTWVTAGLMLLVVGVLAIVDSPALLRRSREQTLVLDRAYTDEDDARTAVEQLLGAPVHRLTIRNLDLVSDTTTVDIRYTAQAASGRTAQPASGRTAQAASVPTAQAHESIAQATR